MSPFEDYLDKITAPGPGRRLPGCVLIAANKDGIYTPTAVFMRVGMGVIYSRCSGTQSVDPDSPLVNTPLEVDTAMWIASCTKLMTSIAVLQCVEKGLLDLDEDISAILPEWKDPNILRGFDEATGEPILEKAKEKVTLRKMLSHQSGMGFPMIHRQLQQFIKHQKATGKMVESGYLRDERFLPLTFEPGTSWAYSVAFDWAGQMVERVNNNQPLGSFMQKHIWGPLGMTSTTFRLRERPDIKSRIADMSIRADDGTIQPGPSQHHRENRPEDRGGGGICATMSDYAKVLIALLKNDGTLLKPATIDLLFTPCLSSDAAKTLNDIWLKGYQQVDKDDIELKIAKQVNHALGGVVSETDLPGGRKAGSMWWGGLPNLSWVIDRQTGLAFLYGSQLLPTHEEVSRRTFRMFEAALYGGELVPIQGEVKA